MSLEINKRAREEPNFELYIESDLRGYGSRAKDLEGALIGIIVNPPEKKRRLTYDTSRFASYIAQKIQQLEDKKMSHKKPTHDEIESYFRRKKILEITGGTIRKELTAREKEVKKWVNYALDIMREEMRDHIQPILEELKAHQSPHVIPAFSHNLKSRAEMDLEIRQSLTKQVIAGIIELINLSHEDYELTDAHSMITQEELADILKKSFKLKKMPKTLEEFVCEPGIDKKSFMEMEDILFDRLDFYHHFQFDIDLIDVIGDYYLKQVQAPELPENIEVDLYSAKDTLIDYVGGVDCWVEIKDTEGNIIDQILIDITENPHAVRGKKKKIEKRESFARLIFLYDKKNLLPIENDPRVTQILNNPNFKDLIQQIVKAVIEKTAEPV